MPTFFIWTLLQAIESLHTNLCYMRQCVSSLYEHWKAAEQHFISYLFFLALF